MLNKVFLWVVLLSIILFSLLLAFSCCKLSRECEELEEAYRASLEGNRERDKDSQ